MRKGTTLLAALAAILTATAATVRTASEAFVTNRIAAVASAATNYTDAAIAPVATTAANAAASASAANVNLALCATKAELNHHAANSNIHVTAAKQDAWNAKQDALPLEDGTGAASVKLKVSGNGATTADGNRAVALGYAAKATGHNAVAFNNQTTASGENSAAIGYKTMATNNAELAAGFLNNPHNGTRFSVGIGVNATGARTNAVEVMANGDVYVRGVGGYTGGESAIPANGVNTLTAEITAIRRDIRGSAAAATNYTDAAIAAAPKPDWNAAPGSVAAIVNRPAVGEIDVADYRDFLAALDTLARSLGGEVVTSSRHYVQDGLVAMWDGIENTAAGTNGLAATTWTDRVGGRAFSIPSGASFTPLGLATTYANGSTIDSSATNFLFVLATNGTYTIEVAYTQTAAISHGANGYNDYRAIFLATGRDTAKFSVGLGLRYNNQVDCVAMTISGDCSNSNAAGGHIRALYPTGGVLGAHTVSYVSASMSAAAILFDGGAQSADFNIPQGDMISGNPRALYFNRNYYTSHGLDGTYHCIRIYSRALTREEVAHNREIDVMRYHGGWRPKTSGLVNDGEDGDHPFASKQEVAAAATAATNYTDEAVANIDIPAPGNYAAVSNAAMSAAAKTAAAATAATNYTDEAVAGKLDAEGNHYTFRNATPGLTIDSELGGSVRTYVFSKPGYEGDPNTVARLSDIPESITPAVVTNIVRDLSLGGIWDDELEVWWTPVMRNGSLTYQATTNVNLNAEN